jgi:hypothetical protein
MPENLPLTMIDLTDDCLQRVFALLVVNEHVYPVILILRQTSRALKQMLDKHFTPGLQLLYSKSPTSFSDFLNATLRYYPCLFSSFVPSSTDKSFTLSRFDMGESRKNDQKYPPPRATAEDWLSFVVSLPIYTKNVLARARFVNMHLKDRFSAEIQASDAFRLKVEAAIKALFDKNDMSLGCALLALLPEDKKSVFLEKEILPDLWAELSKVAKKSYIIGLELDKIRKIIDEKGVVGVTQAELRSSLRTICTHCTTIFPIKLCFVLGADIVPKMVVGDCVYNNLTHLHLLAMNKNISVHMVRFLLFSGVNVNADVDHHGTALNELCQHQKNDWSDILKVFLEFGAKIRGVCEPPLLEDFSYIREEGFFSIEMLMIIIQAGGEICLREKKYGGRPIRVEAIEAILRFGAVQEIPLAASKPNPPSLHIEKKNDDVLLGCCFSHLSSSPAAVANECVEFYRLFLHRHVSYPKRNRPDLIRMLKRITYECTNQQQAISIREILLDMPESIRAEIQNGMHPQSVYHTLDANIEVTELLVRWHDAKPGARPQSEMKALECDDIKNKLQSDRSFVMLTTLSHTEGVDFHCVETLMRVFEPGPLIEMQALGYLMITGLIPTAGKPFETIFLLCLQRELLSLSTFQFWLVQIPSSSYSKLLNKYVRHLAMNPPVFSEAASNRIEKPASPSDIINMFVAKGADIHFVPLVKTENAAECGMSKRVKGVRAFDIFIKECRWAPLLLETMPDHLQALKCLDEVFQAFIDLGAVSNARGMSSLEGSAPLWQALETCVTRGVLPSLTILQSFSRVGFDPSRAHLKRSGVFRHALSRSPLMKERYKAYKAWHKERERSRSGEEEHERPKKDVEKVQTPTYRFWVAPKKPPPTRFSRVASCCVQ